MRNGQESTGISDKTSNTEIRSQISQTQIKMQKIKKEKFINKHLYLNLLNEDHSL